MDIRCPVGAICVTWTFDVLVNQGDRLVVVWDDGLVSKQNQMMVDDDGVEIVLKEGQTLAEWLYLNGDTE